MVIYNGNSIKLGGVYFLDICIFRCEWSGLSCSNVNITSREILTDYGLCYTLNYDGKLKTAATGINMLLYRTYIKLSVL